MQLNIKTMPLYTHEGAKAQHISPLLQLQRTVMSCMLWEDTFYEDGKSISDIIIELIPKVKPNDAFDLAVKARIEGNLRHAPLLIAREMARLSTHKHLISQLLPKIICRADELTEFMAIYWKDGKQPLSAQVKKGLAHAFRKFDEYELAKYDRDNKVKLRDVLFLCHSKPKDIQEDAPKWTKIERKLHTEDKIHKDFTDGELLFQKIVNRTLQTPDTWEVALSAGADKRETFLRLIQEKKLGALAFLRNLRNMTEAGIEKQTIAKYIAELNIKKILPFRFITAAAHNPQLEDILEPLIILSASYKPKLKGNTYLLIDVSGSMDNLLSYESEVTRIQAACGLAMILREQCEEVHVYTFSDNTIYVPPRHGFALKDAIINSQTHHSTCLAAALQFIYQKHANFDRLIVITDEQCHDKINNSALEKIPKRYLINVASYKNGIGYYTFTHIDGFSASVIDWLYEYEQIPQ